MSAYDPEDAVVESVFVKASPERVFRALTEPLELLAWWGDPKVYWCTSWTLDLRVGGRWRCEGTSQRGGTFHVEGEFLDIEPPSRLSYTWRPSWIPTPPTTVGITLTPQAGGTFVTWAMTGFRGHPQALADLLILVALLGACAAVIFAVFYGVSRVLAVVLRFVVRLTGVPPRALVVAGLALGATGVALLVRVHGTANSCDQDATPPFLAAAAVLPLALAVGRQLQRETPARPGAARAIRVLAALAVCAWPVVGAHGFLSRDSGRSRSMMLGDLRTIVSAEAAYAQENGGFYDRLECLARPQDCLSGHAAGKSPFLDPITATMGPRHAFMRTFRPGPDAPRWPSVSRSSLSTWAMLAVPSPRIRGRCQSYCADSSGRICAMADGREAPVVDGLCGLACASLP